MQVMGEKTWRYLEGVKEKTSSKDRGVNNRNKIYEVLSAWPTSTGLRDTQECLETLIVTPEGRERSSAAIMRPEMLLNILH